IANGKPDALSRREDYTHSSEDVKDDKLILNVSLLNSNDNCKEIISVEEQQALIKFYHEDNNSGHPGKFRTWELIKRHYKWKGMEKQVENFVKN
ncbi:hypothetical protein HMI56_006168, partial [Coelomomyces lativittatus]